MELLKRIIQDFRANGNGATLDFCDFFDFFVERRGEKR